MIEVETLQDGLVTRFRMVGTYVMEEIMERITEYYPQAATRVIWDIREGDISELTADEARILARHAATLARHEKTAFLGPDGITFGVLRMYTAYAEIHEVAPNMMAFNRESEAMAWLAES